MSRDTIHPSAGGRWLVVVVFAVAMAWVEAAVVFYLRSLVGRIDPYQPNPMPEYAGLAFAEMVREAATLVMLLAVGWLAGTSNGRRMGYALLAFGVWDLFYYAFLKVLTGWPHSLFDWDILFLLPLPWWGPVLAPVCIAGLMIVWGTLATRGERQGQSVSCNWKSWSLNLVGVALALYVFMKDALRVAGAGEKALRELLPTRFNWLLFGVALALMAAPVAEACWQRRRRNTTRGQPQSI